MTTAPAPSRSEQGAERRAAILAATVRILVRDGLAAVTHRAVAGEAGVPLAATTYYFASKDELIGDALTNLVEDEIQRVRERAAALGDEIGSPARTAPAVAEVLFPDADAAAAMLAKFEVYLEAARVPGLRAVAAHWRQAYTELARRALEAAGATGAARKAPLLVAAVDGVLVHELSGGLGDDLRVDHLQGELEQLFELFVADSA